MPWWPSAISTIASPRAGVTARRSKRRTADRAQRIVRQTQSATAAPTMAPIRAAMPSSPRRTAILKPMNAPATPTSALVTMLRVEPAIWRVSQPGPAKRSKINPATMPMARTMRNVMAGVMRDRHVARSVSSSKDGKGLIVARLHRVVAARKCAYEAHVVTVDRVNARNERDLVVPPAMNGCDLLIGVRDLGIPGNDPAGVVAFEDVARLCAGGGEQHGARDNRGFELHGPIPWISAHLSILPPHS